MELTRREYLHIAVSVLLTLVFSVRGGPMPGAVTTTLKFILAFYLYGVVMVLIFVGLTKKMFKYEPKKEKMLLWVFYLAAFFAISQFFHEGFLAITGQTPR